MNTIIVVTGIAFIFFPITFFFVADVAKKDFGSPVKKVKWHIIAMIPFIGWLIYLIFGFRKGTKIDLSC